MKIGSYIASLLPSFGKSRVIEDIRLTRNEIKELTEPSYATSVQLLRTWKFKSPILKDKFDVFNRMVKKTNGNFVVTVHDGFKNILDNLSTVETLIDKTYNDDVAGSGLTYMKANLLQFAECVSFVSKYSRKFLIFIYVCETIESSEEGTSLNDSLSAAELKWLDDNFLSFCTAFSIAAGEPHSVGKLINDIPDIIITEENAGTLGSTIGNARIDPFQMKLLDCSNPIFHIRVFVAEWQAERYKAAKEELRLVQLRKLNLEKLSQGKPDAHVQKEIEYMETRVQGLNFKIQKMEKDYA